MWWLKTRRPGIRNEGVCGSLRGARRDDQNERESGGAGAVFPGSAAGRRRLGDPLSDRQANQAADRDPETGGVGDRGGGDSGLDLRRLL